MSVMELQSKFFPIKSRANLMASEIRNAINIASLFPQRDEPMTERVGSGRKLQEPRQLYSTASLQHPPKWPIECQVISDKIYHLNIPSGSMERFYTATNSEPQPRPVGEEMGIVIFNYQPKLSVDYYCRSCVGGLSEDLTVQPTDETTLAFESRFESGNLAKVIKVTNVYYELYLRPDMYTDRHAQWYYFRIQNTRENIVYRFSIVNLSKPDSLYRYGMKPLMYSERNADINGIGWIRCGYNISYYKNDITTTDNLSSYTLTFNLTFGHSNDTVYIAQCYPYTYSTLQSYLQGIQSDRNKSRYCQQRLLCKSLAGNNIYVLTITSPDNQEDEDQIQEIVKKPAVILTARVHPGETPSSYMMKGMIEFLTSDSSHAQELRDRFIFKLIPMLNPDGVIVGNSRCCLLGTDLNRQYRTVLREAFPQIYHTKVLLRRLVDENGIFLYCDIHGHSRKNNVFMYGCENRRITEKKLTEQVFPLMMHKNAADKFSFANCKFRIQKSKEGTGRIFVWTLGVANSYTLEISLGGSTLVSREYTHFNYVDYEDLGRHFSETLLDYSDTGVIKEKIRQKILQKLIDSGSTADEPRNIPISDYSSLSHSDPDDESDTTEEDEEQEIQKTKASFFRQTTLRKSKVKVTSDKGSYKLDKKLDTARSGKKSNQKIDQITMETTYESKRFRSYAFTPKNQGSSFVKSQLMSTHKQNRITSILSTMKYTNLLFQDPFKPPDIVVTSARDEQDETVDTGTQTEDECDHTDVSMKNEYYLPRNSSRRLINHFQSLSLLTTSTAQSKATNGSNKNVPCSTVKSEKFHLKLPSLGKLNPEQRRGSFCANDTTKKVKSKVRQSKSHDDISHTMSQKLIREFGMSRLVGAGASTAHSPSPNHKIPQQIVSSTTINRIPKLSPMPKRRISWAGGAIEVSELIRIDSLGRKVAKKAAVRSFSTDKKAPLSRENKEERRNKSGKKQEEISS